MKTESNITLELFDSERKSLRKNKIKKAEIINYVPDELSALLDISNQRALELVALVDFQRISSIGIEFQ